MNLATTRRSKNLSNISVLGLGTMGHGIAQIFAMAGYHVRGFDEVAAARDSTSARIKANLDLMTSTGLFDGDAEAALNRITVCETEEEALEGAQVVTEAIREDLELKVAMFARIEAYIDTQCIVVSNTSSYPMTQMSVRMKHPERALNTHWFNPPHIIPLVEVIPGERTAQATVDVTMSLLKQAGKLPVLLKKEIPGFLVNRVQMAMLRELVDLRERGVASTEEIDLAIRHSVAIRLAALGPLAVMDYAGLDVNQEVMRVLAPDLAQGSEFPPSVKALVDQGHYGAKTGRGLYDYSDGELERRIADRDRLYMALLQTMKEAGGC